MDQARGESGFPYPDGDVLVLGPEVFASSDEAVICWRGVNYVPQRRSRLAPWLWWLIYLLTVAKRKLADWAFRLDSSRRCL